MTADDAKQLALRSIQTHWQVDGDEPIIIDDHTREETFGWIFSTQRGGFTKPETFAMLSQGTGLSELIGSRTKLFTSALPVG